MEVFDFYRVVVARAGDRLPDEAMVITGGDGGDVDGTVAGARTETRRGVLEWMIRPS